MLQRVAMDAVFDRVVSNAASLTVTHPCVTYILVSIAVDGMIIVSRAVIFSDASIMPTFASPPQCCTNINSFREWYNIIYPTIFPVELL